jgi:hypothetical protein
MMLVVATRELIGLDALRLAGSLPRRCTSGTLRFRLSMFVRFEHLTATINKSARVDLQVHSTSVT